MAQYMGILSGLSKQPDHPCSSECKYDIEVSYADPPAPLLPATKSGASKYINDTHCERA